MIAALMLFI